MFKQALKTKQIFIFGFLLTAGFLLQSINNINIPDMIQDTITLSLGIIYEAIPFVIFGVIISVLIQRYLSQEKIYKILPKKGYFRRPVLSVLGVFLPVCECGNIPLARGLIQKGLKPGEVLTFLFAAPIINPITIYTTTQAFSSQPEVMYIRVLAAFLIANFVGTLFAKSSKKEMLTAEFNGICELHDDHKKHSSKSIEKVKYLSSNFREEFMRLMPSLVGGSLLAGVIQTTIPRSILLSVSSDPILAILAMIALAFIVSICANVDAFFALSLSTIFPISSIVAFLVFGPMIDIKILSMLRTTFKNWVLISVSIVIFFLSLLTGLVVQYAL